MIELLEKEISKHGDKPKIVSINRLPDLKQDVENLKNSGFLNDFQKHIANDHYSFDLPDTDVRIYSTIIIASPSPSAKVTFNWKGKRIPLMLPASYIDMDIAPRRIEEYLKEFLGPRGYHIKYASRLPYKLLAVRSGLGVYGRNNICYVEGMGSLLRLEAYFSDIPCPEGSLYEIRQMDSCNTCKACLNNCPTGAITNERFLLNNERCLTYFNEAGGEDDFPEWIDPSWHNCICGCVKCQAICPKNKEYLNNIVEPLEFTAVETLLLLEGKSFGQFPEELKQKVEGLGISQYLGALPRNLKVLLDRKD